MKPSQIREVSRCVHPGTLPGGDAAWRWLADRLHMPALLATPLRALEDCALPTPQVTPQAIQAFAAILGADRIKQDDASRAGHARGRSYHDRLLLRAGDVSTAPDAVLFPRGEDDVLAVLAAAAEMGIPVVPCGAAAGPGQITLNLSGMDRLLAQDKIAATATLEAGVTRPALEREGGHAMPAWWPQDYAYATLGGAVASASRIPDWLVGLRLATPSGVVADADLLSLVTGSRGALGVITQMTVRVTPALPQSDGFAFADAATGATCLRQAAQSGIDCTLLHLFDAETTALQRGLIQAHEDWRTRLKHRLVDRPAHPVVLAGHLLHADARRQFATLAKKQGARAMDDSDIRAVLDGWHHAPCQRDILLDRGLGVERIETRVPWSKWPALQSTVAAALDQAMRQTAPMPGARGLVQSEWDDATPDSVRLVFTVIFPRDLKDPLAQMRAIRQAGDAAIRAASGKADPIDAVFDPNGIIRAVKTVLDNKTR